MESCQITRVKRGIHSHVLTTLNQFSTGLFYTLQLFIAHCDSVLSMSRSSRSIIRR